MYISQSTCLQVLLVEEGSVAGVEEAAEPALQEAGLLRVPLQVDVEAALGRELLAAALEGADEGVRERVVRQLVVLEVLRAQVRLLESVQQSKFETRFAFWHFNLKIWVQIRTVIPI